MRGIKGGLGEQEGQSRGRGVGFAQTHKEPGWEKRDVQRGHEKEAAFTFALPSDWGKNRSMARKVARRKGLPVVRGRD